MSKYKLGFKAESVNYAANPHLEQRITIHVRKGDGAPFSIEECDSAERLIACAPQLLEALKTVREMIPHRSGDCFSNDYMGACVCGKAIAERAIAKAEGK